MKRYIYILIFTMMAAIVGIMMPCGYMRADRKNAQGSYTMILICRDGSRHALLVRPELRVSVEGDTLKFKSNIENVEYALCDIAGWNYEYSVPTAIDITEYEMPRLMLTDEGIEITTPDGRNPAVIICDESGKRILAVNIDAHRVIRRESIGKGVRIVIIEGLPPVKMYIR